MYKIKQLAIYMDFSNAYLMELTNKMIVSRNIEFENNKKGQEDSLNRIALLSHSNAEHHLQSAYYIEISNIIRNYNQVVLFGPNDAKNELFRLLEFDHNFDNIKIQNVNTDTMTQNQIHDFVKEYFK